MEQVKHLTDFQVIEFRRYMITEGEREHFAQYFQSYFPEAIQQLGAIVFGQFLERKNHNLFTWIRGFKNMDARATINAALYYGPLWKEHRATMNNLLVDSDNVLLLRPLNQERGVLVLPAVDPVYETKGAQGKYLRLRQTPSKPLPNRQNQRLPPIAVQARAKPVFWSHSMCQIISLSSRSERMVHTSYGWAFLKITRNWRLSLFL